MTNSTYFEKSIRNKSAYFDRANLFVELANSTEQHLTNNLILVATVFLGLSSPLVSNLSNLPSVGRTLLFISWAFTIISILFGFGQIYINIKFFEKSFKFQNRLEGIWSKLPSTQPEYNSVLRVSKELAKDNDTQSTFMPLILQALSMVLAIALAVTVGIIVLTNTGGHQTKSNYIFDYYDQPTKSNARTRYFYTLNKVILPIR